MSYSSWSRKAISYASFLGVLSALLLLGSTSSCTSLKSGKTLAGNKPVKVLFLGNSHTDGIQKVFRDVVSTSPYKDSTFMFVWGGGASLQRLIDNGRAHKWIKTDSWDIVVLQEHSLRPAISEYTESLFHKSVDSLVKDVRNIGAEPILYMTWGRRDGIPDGNENLKDYQTIQELAKKACHKAGKRNGIRIAPVGEAWSRIWRSDKDLFKALYQNDGNHCSRKGAFLASCVFLRTFFDDSLKTVAACEGVTVDEAKAIKRAVLAK